MKNLLVFVDIYATRDAAKPAALVFTATDVESTDNGDLQVWHDEALKFTVDHRDLKNGLAKIRIRPENF